MLLDQSVGRPSAKDKLPAETACRAFPARLDAVHLPVQALPVSGRRAVRMSTLLRTASAGI